MRCSAACTSASARSPASSTTTSRGRRRTATSRCTPSCRATTAARSRSRSAPREMHEHAEYGVVAHWAYKEAGAAGYAGGQRRRRVRGARRRRRAWSCCASCWPGSATSPATARRRRRRAPAPSERGASTTASTSSRRRRRVVELPRGATPIDFAYAVHTDLGHRCRGAQGRRRDGAAEHAAAERPDGRGHRRQGGRPVARLAQRRARLPAERALEGQGARLVQRAGAGARPIARGREAVEKLLQREGKTALKLDDLAARLGFRSADALFEVVGKDEFSLRNIEALLRPAPAPRADADDAGAPAVARAERAAGGVLVVGVDSLLTHAGALLPAGAARRDRRLRHARQGRRACTAPAAATCASWSRARPSASSPSRGARRRGDGRRSIRSTSASRRATGRACCATSPRCSRRRR